MEMNHGLPVLLNLEGRVCAVVGAGPHAEEKAGELRAAGAVVRRITRRFEETDLDGAALAVSGSEAEENRRVYEAAVRRGIPVNSLDDPAHCSFYFPSVVRRGGLVVAVSTSGRCPALAVRLKEWLGRLIGKEYGDFVDLAGGLRREIRESVPDADERRRLWYELVDSPALGLLREGKREEALRLLRGRVAERPVAQ
jgi:siroheme synthase-like protein